MRSKFSCGIAAMLLAVSAAAGQAPKIGSDTANLEALFAAKDWNKIGAVVSHPKTSDAVEAETVWLRTKVEAGQGGMFLPMLLANHLWAIGKVDTVRPGQVDQLRLDPRLQAGEMTLYTFELVMVDGQRCADTTAPGHRADQILLGHADTLAYLRSRPASVKAKVIDAALGEEHRTASARGPDELLCSWGADENMAAVKAGLAREVPGSKPGEHKYVVDPVPGWKPEFLPVAASEPKQQKIRAQMRELLAKLIQ